MVIDEVHWLADRDRGSAWTRALLSLPCRELHLVGSADILPALRAAFPDLEVRSYDRLAPLRYVGTVPIERVEPGTAVIAFSRKAVLALARDLSVAHPGKVGVLYGAMPLGERKRQAAAFRDGALDVLCATDVLGHGLNLPIRTVLFAESDKWNGTARADLEPWEVAQIAGRAGRFGMHDEGGVGILSGHHWATPRANVIKAGLRPRPDREGLPTFRRLTTMNLGPAYTDVAHAATETWPTLLLRWEAIARGLVQEQLATWLRVAAVDSMVARLGALGRRTLRSLPPEDAWTFALAPVEPRDESDLIARLGKAVLGDGTLRDLVDFSTLEHATVRGGRGRRRPCRRAPLVHAPLPGHRRHHPRGRRPPGVARHGGRRPRPGRGDRHQHLRHLPDLRQARDPRPSAVRCLLARGAVGRPSGSCRAGTGPGIGTPQAVGRARQGSQATRPPMARQAQVDPHCGDH